MSIIADGPPRPPASVYDLVLRRPRVMVVGTVRLGWDRTPGWILEGWHFAGRPGAESFTLAELSQIKELCRSGDLEVGPEGLCVTPARMKRDRAEVAVWVGMKGDPERLARARPGTDVGLGAELRRQAEDLRLRAQRSPHDKLLHLTRQADKLDARADLLDRVHRRRPVQRELLAIMQALARGD